MAPAGDGAADAGQRADRGDRRRRRRRPTRRAPLGRVVGARSGDKGGNANLGVFARTEGYAWLAAFLTVARLELLLPEAPLLVERHALPNLRSLNFVIAACSRRAWRRQPHRRPGQEPR